MTKHPLRRASALIAIVITVFLANTAPLQASVPSAENLLPSDTLAFVTVPDCAAMGVASKTSPGTMWMNDPAMKPIRDKFMNKLREKIIAPLEKDLGMKMDDFLDVPQGQFTLALTFNGSTLNDDILPGVVLLLDAKDKSSLLKSNLDSLQKKWIATGRTFRTMDIRSVPFTVLTLNSNDFAAMLSKKKKVKLDEEEEGAAPVGKTKKPEKVEIFFAQIDSLLVAANSTKALDAIVAHIKGGNVPSIADNKEFAADKISQFRNNPNYYGWFNAKAVIAHLAKITPPKSSDAGEVDPMADITPAKVIEALGLNGLDSMSFAGSESREGSVFNLHISAPENRRAGLLKIIALPAKDAAPPAFVPADVIKFSRTRLDLKKTWDDILAIAKNISPEAANGLNGMLDMANMMAQQKDKNFDIRTSFFANLGDDLISYGKAPADSSLTNIANAPEIFLLSVKNPDQVIGTVKTMLSLSSEKADEPREFLGRKIHTISMPGALGSESTIYIAASGGYIAISDKTAMIEEYLRSADKPPKPLRDTAGIAEAAQRVGGMSSGMFGYENQRESMKVAFGALKSPEFGGMLGMILPGFREWVDVSLMPDFEKVAKYFGIAVWSGSADAGGMTIKIYAPRPAGLN